MKETDDAPESPGLKFANGHNSPAPVFRCFRPKAVCLIRTDELKTCTPALSTVARQSIHQRQYETAQPCSDDRAGPEITCHNRQLTCGVTG
jgi:hypothetical protein